MNGIGSGNDEGRGRTEWSDRRRERKRKLACGGEVHERRVGGLRLRSLSVWTRSGIRHRPSFVREMQLTELVLHRKFNDAERGRRGRRSRGRRGQRA